MARVPDHPKIFHITHVDNLPGIVQAGGLWSDAKRLELGLDCEVVGMSGIKERRLNELRVKCHPGTKVGEYVPFYLCPRSIMLYILHMGNHPDLTYRGGQRPIIHLVADLRAVVAWAEARKRLWALSNRNAGTYYAEFFSGLEDLPKINWDAVAALDFRDPAVKESKQAELLLYDSFPWELVEKIGVLDNGVVAEAMAALEGSQHKPAVRVERSWYF